MLPHRTVSPPLLLSRVAYAASAVFCGFARLSLFLLRTQRRTVCLFSIYTDLLTVAALRHGGSTRLSRSQFVAAFRCLIWVAHRDCRALGALHQRVGARPSQRSTQRLASRSLRCCQHGAHAAAALAGGVAAYGDSWRCMVSRRATAANSVLSSATMVRARKYLSRRQQRRV